MKNFKPPRPIMPKPPKQFHEEEDRAKYWLSFLKYRSDLNQWEEDVAAIKRQQHLAKRKSRAEELIYRS
jgi:hypothetical protein